LFLTKDGFNVVLAEVNEGGDGGGLEPHHNGDGLPVAGVGDWAVIEFSEYYDGR